MTSDTDLCQNYMNRFINRTELWFRQWVDVDRKCQYACVKSGAKRYEPVTLPLIARHLKGEVTCSWPAINETGKSKWCCWDSDFENGDIVRIADVLNRLRLVSHREAVRPGRDGHLWMFFDEPIEAEQLLRLNREVLAHAGVMLKSRAYPSGVEFFPASSSRLSQVRGPLGVHRKPGANNARGWFVQPEQNLKAQLEWLTSAPSNSSQIISNMVKPLFAADLARQAIAEPRVIQPYPRGAARVDILTLVADRRWNGRDWIARCPLCALEGHDKASDNLRISADGKIFCCVYGGPASTHSARSIVAALYD